MPNMRALGLKLPYHPMRLFTLVIWPGVYSPLINFLQGDFPGQTHIVNRELIIKTLLTRQRQWHDNMIIEIFSSKANFTKARRDKTPKYVIYFQSCVPFGRRYYHISQVRKFSICATCATSVIPITAFKFSPLY